MGDRTWTKVICCPEHQAVFEEEGFTRQEGEDPENLPGAIALISEEADYGSDTTFTEISEKGGVPFLASHGHGYEYGAGRSACDGRRVVHVECSHGIGFPTVEVPEDGHPDSQQLDLVREYYEVLAAAKEAISDAEV